MSDILAKAEWKKSARREGAPLGVATAPNKRAGRTSRPTGAAMSLLDILNPSSCREFAEFHRQ